MTHLRYLNKMIVSYFPKYGTVEQKLIKYRMLNIFYNRDAEIELDTKQRRVKIKKCPNHREILFDGVGDACSRSPQ